MRLMLVTAAALCAAAVLVWAGEHASAATVQVSAVDFEFNPDDITIDAGDTVEWEFSGNDHTVTSIGSGPLDSGTQSDGSTFSHTFTTAGTYQYYCTIHGDAGTFTGMVGTVNVTAQETATATTTSQTSPTPTRTRTATATPEGTATAGPSTTPPPATATAVSGGSPQPQPSIAITTGSPSGGAQPQTSLPVAGTGRHEGRRSVAAMLLAAGIATLGMAAAVRLARR
jgi:plastocyanin